MRKNTTFEQAMHRLDEVVATLESGDAPLEQSLKLYAEGAELVAFCSGKLEDAKLKMEKLFSKEGEDVDGLV